MDYKFVTLNVALFGFFGIIYLAVTHKRSSIALDAANEQKINAIGLNQSALNDVTAFTFNDVVTVTRIHRGEAASMADVTKVIRFIEGALTYSALTCVCIDLGNSFENRNYFDELKATVESREDLASRTKLIPITPWGKFTQALNAAVQLGMEQKMDKIIYQSLELAIDPKYASRLIRIVNSDATVLVVGPELTGHQFREGRQVLSGRTCPWNTFAVWRLKFLALSGFPLVSDGMGLNFGGVEEIATVAILQRLRPHLRALLIRNNNNPTSWDTNFNGDPAREQWHARKMNSKETRAAKQLELLNLDKSPGFVEHIII